MRRIHDNWLDQTGNKPGAVFTLSWFPRQAGHLVGRSAKILMDENEAS
jgi:hypothetical protein